MTEISIDMDRYRAWYRNPLVLKSLVYQLKYREGAVLGAMNIRNMKIREFSHLRQNINRFGLLDSPVNWYYSLAILGRMPVFSFNMEERKRQSKVFEQDFHVFMKGYDWALDFDSKNTSKDIALGDMRKTHNWMKGMNIPHTVRCSGSGFHVIVYSNYVWQPPLFFKSDLSPTLCSVMGKGLKKELDLKSLDSSIYDSRRIFKVPYSLDIRSGNVCRPLSDYEIDNFEYSLVKPEYCAGRRDVFYKRGMFLGTSRSLHKWIFSMFRGYCKNTREIWSRIRELKHNAHPLDSPDIGRNYMKIEETK